MDDKYLDLPPSIMPDMPMQNYEDLPIDHIPSWVAYFNSLASGDKTVLMEKMYLSLDDNEQGLVIQDLGRF